MTVTLNLHPVVELTDDQFYEICQANRDLRLERTATGEIIIMPPPGGETGHRNIKLVFQLEAWSSQKDLGLAFDSSLPDALERLRQGEMIVEISNTP